MKPCPKNRKAIAWLALDTMNSQEAAELREHLAHCEGCRRYAEEISTVTKGLAAAISDSTLTASESFHRKVAAGLQPAASTSVLAEWTPWFRATLSQWRVAIPAVAGLAIVLAVMTSRQPATPIKVQVEASHSENNLAPTIANYQMVASQSLEKLSDMLTQQGNKPLPPAPTYTLSSFDLANSPN